MGREGNPAGAPHPCLDSDTDSFSLQLIQPPYAGLTCLSVNERIIPHSHLEFELPFKKGSFLT